MFEATACGAMLLTDRAENGLADLFHVGEEIIVYDGIDDLIELAGYYLEDNRERERIALNGMKRCRNEHTYDNRAASLLQMLHL